VTKLPAGALQTKDIYDGWDPSDWTVAERLSWTMGRRTKRTEHSVYCLLGVLDVHMRPIYGEGLSHALKRLLRKLYRPGNYHKGVFLAPFESGSPPTEGEGTEVQRHYIWQCHCTYGLWTRTSSACGACGYGRYRICPSMAVPRTGPDEYT
jgi:hypothetical protein